MPASHTADHPTRRYLAIWGWLAGLMLLGVALSELPLPKLTIVLVVLALSSVKAVLVGMYYMHLKMDARLLRLVALGPLVLILLALSVVFSSRLLHF
jgi:caa(3)-type oxidase subunit IV